jgi:hypothetical protein
MRNVTTMQRCNSCRERTVVKAQVDASAWLEFCVTDPSFLSSSQKYIAGRSSLAVAHISSSSLYRACYRTCAVVANAHANDESLKTLKQRVADQLGGGGTPSAKPKPKKEKPCAMLS